MAYKMSVIIPCYKATETLSKTLHSIAMQSISDEIEVVLVNDCDALYYGDIIARFYPDLHINYVCNPENRGCGGARNTGIRAAAAEYITFIDADDQFTNSLALEIMYNRIMAEKADMLVSVFESEMRFTDGVAIRKMEHKPTWCHAKIYRRQFLIDNNLFFDENLRINEDAEFHQILIDLGAKVAEIPMVTLMWRDNPKSITHQSLYDNKKTFIQASLGYLRECKRRDMQKDKVTLRTLQNLVVIYQYYNIVLDDCPENDDDFIFWCKKYWEDCESIVGEVDDEYITKVYCGIMKDFKSIPNITFVQFLNRIKGVS